MSSKRVLGLSIVPRYKRRNVTVGLIWLALLAVSCGNEDDPSEDVPSNTSDDAELGDTADTDTVEGVVPSAGCELAESSPDRGELTLSLDGEDAPYILTLPEDYDGETPMSLVFVFHGAGRTHSNMYNTDAPRIRSTVGAANVVVYPKSQAGDAWTSNAEATANTAFFEALLDEMLDQYCIDTTRIFATGLSSGGYFTNLLACRYGDLLRGVAPVSGGLMETSCEGQVAAMVIHGVRDSVVDPVNGERSRDHYLELNSCDDSTTDLDNEECVAYEGCDAAYPVAYCTHDEPTYDDTNHGWPSFASEAIAAFFASLD